MRERIGRRVRWYDVRTSTWLRAQTALRDASIAIDREFFWGRPATNIVRDVIRSRSRTTYRHWLTGFNRDLATSFSAVRGVFEEAAKQLRTQVESGR